jgi:hypothetical protein
MNDKDKLIADKVNQILDKMERSYLSDGFKSEKSFRSLCSVKYGTKYIKIKSKHAVWGFIVNTDSHPKFKYGDVLKASCRNAPAINFIRGNVFDTNFLDRVKWTSIY